MEYKKYRQSFIEFIQWYNSIKPPLTPECKTAIASLYSLWKSIDPSSPVGIFFTMKEYHTIINGELLIKTPTVAWEKYIHAGSEFRTKLLFEMHKDSKN